MNLLLDAGLNLNDPSKLEEGELAIAQNADFRHGGLARSRDGRTSVYTSQGTTLIGMANSVLYSIGSLIYRAGVSMTGAISAVQAIGVTKLRNVSDEVLLVADGSSNYKADTSRMVWGIATPTAIPTAALSGTGITGNYYYRYTYARKSGSTLIHESNPSSPSLIASPSNQTVDVTWTASSDSQVTHVRLYRTLNNGASGGEEYLYLTEGAVGTTTYPDSTNDAGLGALAEFDNDPPPANIRAIAGPGAYNTIFVAVDNKVYFAKAGRPESFPPLYYIEAGVPSHPSMALVDWAGLLFIFTDNAVYYLQGTDPDTYYPIKTMSSRGLAAKQAIRATEKGILFLAYDGVYAFNGQSESKLTGDKVDSLFRGESVNGVSPLNTSSISNCWMEYFNGKMFLGYPDSTYTSPNKVLVYDFEEKKFSIFDYSLTITSAFTDDTNHRLLLGDSNGTVWRAEYGESDGGSAFTFTIRSKELSLITQSPPNFVRLNIDNAGGNTITAKWLSKGVSQQSYSLTDSDNRKRRVIAPITLDSPQLEVTASVTSRVAVGMIEIT